MLFSHISPVPHLRDFATNRPFHLTLAHLVERDKQYTEFYLEEKFKNPKMVNIMDNSAFEMVQMMRGYYEVKDLLQLAKKIQADYIVMTDHPGQPAEMTVNSATNSVIPIKEAGFGTFFVPQSRIPQDPRFIDESVKELTDCFLWALNVVEIDYIGFSILAIPNAYGVYNTSPLQRYLSRYIFVQHLEKACLAKYNCTLNEIKIRNNKKFHFLGMTDGPKEILLMNTLPMIIDTWDSSAAVWAGLNRVAFDNSPTGLIGGKVKEHVDFSRYVWDSRLLEIAHNNIARIDEYVEQH